MHIEITCKCGVELCLPVQTAGKRFVCPNCRKTANIPSFYTLKASEIIGDQMEQDSVFFTNKSVSRRQKFNENLSSDKMCMVY